ncbi:calcium uniporter protein 4, mitochondrial [Punica granatum]|uniref:Calcium uniporter protein C-terminal domain-containing protein n=2 Tax=Punica granatum TaxID=22663 RepID=A0A218WNT5_PUNGR|nr:calcium uniporter protein 4, mitochondrial [Punica granatum]OWM74494.1 hypothetical protein CDL15_Pgr003997 [Punica granatum]PKI76464.1 hypothetical protein CRG98_003135 [Punica granatum]
MALRKTLTERLLGCRRAPPPLPAAKLGSSPSPASDPALPLRREYYTSPKSGGRGILRRFLHGRRPLNDVATEILSGGRLQEQLSSIGASRNRLRLEGLSPPAPAPATGFPEFGGLSVLDTRKLLRLARMELLKAELRGISESSISYSEFINICNRTCGSNDEAMEFAKMLDESGNVIVLGNVVFLRPEQVAKSMEAILCQYMTVPNDSRRAELEQMEEQKLAIDRKARVHVQAELYSGLGLLVAQTLLFMRLTFWELTWDVMEPICFFVTSLHFALAYGFFLRTSTEPSFKGYFDQRFRTKQRKLMRAQNFDVDRYNELCKVFYPKEVGSSRGKEPLSAMALGRD